MTINIKTIFYLLFCRFLIDILYYLISFKIYAYQGYSADIELYISNLPISLFFIIPFIFNDNRSTVSSYLVFILLIGILLPLSTLYAFGSTPFVWYIINLFAFIFIVLINNAISNIDIDIPSLSNFTVFKLIFYSFYTVSIFLFLTKYGLDINISNFSLTSELIYNQRSYFKDSNPGYLILNFFTLGPPLLFAYSVIYKTRFLTIISFLLTIIIFSTSSEKSLLFSMVLYAGIIFVHKLYSKIQQTDLIKGYILMILSASSIYFFNSILSALFINRLIFTPQLVATFYYEYFQKYDYSYFLDTSIFSLIFGKSYHTNIAKELGRSFFGDETNLNAGLIADGYSKFGIIGVFIVCIVFIMILKIIDIFSKNKNTLFIKLLMTYSVFTMINSSIFTVFFTSGLFLSLIFLILLPLDNKELKFIYEK
mgnify:CR=1 FL=1